MRDIHLNRELLRAIAKGEVEPRALVRLGLEHLRCLCPTCAAEWEAWESERQAGAHDGIAYRLPGFLAGQLCQIESAEKVAREEFQELEAIEPARRFSRVMRSRNRFRSAALVRLMIAEARRAVHSDHSRAYHFADLAVYVAERLSGSEMTQGWVPLAMAEKANALRLKPDSGGAQELFDLSRALAQIAVQADPSVIARIDQLEASLNLDLRRFSEAERLLDRARTLYGLVGSTANVVRVEIARSLVFLESGQPLKAFQTVKEVLKSPILEEDQQLYLGARLNLALALFEMKDLRAAKKILDQDQPRHAQAEEPLTHLRYAWIRGRIAAAERDLASAKSHFSSVRDGFIAAGVVYDAALVSLDLALASLREGHMEIVRQLAEEMLPIFASQNIHREALAALRLFQEAVQHESLTEALVRDLKNYLVEARCLPEVRFHPGAGAGN